MLIAHCEIMNGNKSIVSSPVRLQPSKYIDDIWPGAVYMSLLDHVVKVVRISTEREGNVLDIPSVDLNQTAGKKIESYSEVLNDVPYNGRKIVRNLVLNTNNEKVIEGLGILLNHDSIRIFCNEVSDLTLKLTYVFFGGVNLKFRSLKDRQFHLIILDQRQVSVND
jgi:hypothetical protein